MAMDTEEHDVAFLASFAEPKLIFEQARVRGRASANP